MVRHRSRVGAPALLLVLLAGSAGCTPSDDDAAAPPPAPAAGGGTSADVAVERPLTVRTRVTRVAGKLPAARRDRWVAGADRVVTGYLHGVLGSGDPFADFTRGARALAAESALPEVPDRLRAGRASAYLAVLAPEGRLVGATARFRVPLRAEQDAAGRPPAAELAGRLLLTPTGSGWRVFGYDVTWPDGRRTRSGGAR